MLAALGAGVRSVLVLIYLGDSKEAATILMEVRFPHTRKKEVGCYPADERI